MRNSFGKNSINIFTSRLVVQPLLIFLLTATGCAQLGPDLIKAGRNEYNKVLAQTNDEETLLNLVRLRYADNPVIMQVNSVSTSFTWNQGLQVEGESYESGSNDTFIGGRGNLEYTERPTITYTPLAGADYVERILTPLEIDSLLLLSKSGWGIDRLMLLTVNRMNAINNAPQSSGPTPTEAPEFEKFQDAVKLLREVQKKNFINSGYIKKDDQIIAGISFTSGKDSPEVRALANVLGIDPNQQLIILDKNAHLRRKDALGLEMRSLTGIYFFLSHGVQVPEQDVSLGRVTTTINTDGEPFDWSKVLGDLFVVHVHTDRPTNAAVAVNYRGRWFYIDDADRSSKYTFMLLRQLSDLQSGKTERTGPLLTLPVTGG